MAGAIKRSALWIAAMSLALAVVADAAHGADAPVDFVANNPLTVELAQLRADDGIAIELHNTTSQDVDVVLRVAGLQATSGKQEPALDALFDPDGVRARVPAAQDADVSLAAAGAKDPAPGSYSGQLVAVPEAGATIARRTLTVTVPAPAPASVSGAVLEGGALPDLTQPAINFVPSPLATLGPTLFVVAALLAVLLVIWWRRFATDARSVGVILIVALAAVALGPLHGLGGILSSGDDLAQEQGWSKVVPKSLPVASTAKDGRAGVVLDDEGDVAELVVAPDGNRKKLDVRDLEQAGVHTGKVDLNGSAEGSAKSTVNVRDWWPWALLAILIGAVSGYRLRRWFDQDRARQRLRLRARSVRDRVTAALTDSDARENWVPIRRTDARLQAIETRLRNDDALVDIEKDVDALETYIDSSDALRDRVRELAAMHASYEERWEERPLGVARAEIPALEAADEVLELPFDSRNPDVVEASVLKRAQEKLDAAIELVGSGLRAFVRIGRLIDRLSTAETEAEELGEPTQPFRKPRTELELLAASVLRAATTASIDAAYGKALEKLPAELPEGPAGLGDVTAPEEASPIDQEQYDRIEFGVRAAPGVDPRTEGNVDDLFGYRLVLADLPQRPMEVKWHVDGKEVETQQIRDARESSWWHHRFDKPGQYQVTVQQRDGSTLATHQQGVTGPSRLGVERWAFGERERRFTLIAFALSLASGMLSLYLAEPAWGTNEDYVKALLWGAVVSEGVALIGAVLANRFPTGK